MKFQDFWCNIVSLLFVMQAHRAATSSAGQSTQLSNVGFGGARAIPNQPSAQGPSTQKTSSQNQQELVQCQTEALLCTRKLRNDLGLLFQHISSGIQQSEQPNQASMDGAVKSPRELFLEQLRNTQSNITKNMNEVIKYVNLMHSKAQIVLNNSMAGVNVPSLILSAKLGDENQHALIKMAGASSPCVFNRYQEALNSTFTCEQLEINAAAIAEALPSQDSAIFKRRSLGSRYISWKPPPIESKLKDHSKNYSEEGVSLFIKSLAEFGVIYVRIEKVCNIYFFIKDSQIETLNCIGLDEIDNDTDYTSPKLRTLSKHKIFRNFGLFIQSYYFSLLRPNYPPTNDDAIVKTLRVFRYYRDFLNEHCAKCGRIMLRGLPPLCMDHRVLETEKMNTSHDKMPKYHKQCFPFNL